MLSLANLEFEVLQQTEIETVYPRSASGISLSILSFVILQVRILLYESPESNAVFLCLEVDFTIILRNIHQVVVDAVAVHVVGVAEAVTAGRITGIEQIQVCAAKQAFVSEGDVVAHRSNHLIGNHIL